MSFYIFIFAGTFSFIVCFFSFRLGKVFSVMDIPDGKRKLHSRPVPLIGGIASMIPVVITALILSKFSDFEKLYLVFGVGTLMLFILGLVDDIRNIPAIFRLLFSIIVSILVILFVPGLAVTFIIFSPETQSFFGGPYFLNFIPGLIFTTICLVGFQNAVNMADGNNGIVTGMSMVWSLLLVSYAPSHLLPLLITFIICINAVMLFNLAGRLFLGDAGTYGISMIIGLTTLYVYNTNFSFLSADKIVLMFLIPILDTIRLMTYRLIKGRSPFSSDREHFHHILRKFLPASLSIVFYLSMVALPCLFVRFFHNLTFLFIVMVFFLYVLIIFIYEISKFKFSIDVNSK